MPVVASRMPDRPLGERCAQAAIRMEELQRRVHRAETGQRRSTVLALVAWR